MLTQPQRCLREGARAEQLQNASQGISPAHPLPLQAVDPTLGQLPFYYLQSRADGGTPLYTSLDDAFKGENAYRTVEPGFVFFSWIERFEREGDVAYMIVPGVYIRGDGMARLNAPTFRGLAFNRTPTQPFAWVLGHADTRRTPGSNDLTGRSVERFQLVYVYDEQEVLGYTWYKIGPEDWVEDRTLAVLRPDPTRPADVQSDRWISINLYEQTLAVYEGGRLSLRHAGFDRARWLVDAARHLPGVQETGSRPHVGLLYRRSFRLLLPGRRALDPVLRPVAGPAWRVLA